MANGSRKIQKAVAKTMNRSSKAALGAQRAQNFATRTGAKTKKAVVKKTPDMIKSIGNSLSTVTTPFVTAKTTEKVATERTARQRSIADTNQANRDLAEWQELMAGNPDPEAGSDGKTWRGDRSILD